MNLLSGWQYMHRLWTVRFAAIGIVYASAAGAWVLMPSDWQPHIPEWGRWALTVIGVTIAASPLVARLVAQPVAIAEIAAKVAKQESAP